jgi:hypothetical protein
VSSPAPGERPAASPPFDPDAVDLAGLDHAYRRSLRLGRPAGLPVVGYGEISLAFGWPPDAPTVVAKSLPTFPDAGRLRAYVGLLEEYLATLADRGVEPLPTAVRWVGAPGRGRTYALQPWLPAAAIVPAVLARAGRDEGEALLADIVAAVCRAVDPVVGLDGQASNWAVLDGRLRYLDVSTPMLRDSAGRDRLDVDLLVEAVPWLLRRPVARFVAPSILSPYHDRRQVVLDLAGNLLRERLAAWIPVVLQVAEPHVDPPLGAAEVARYYRGNARLWSAVQRLRRADRWWQRTIRRRPYPSLLPEQYAR